MIQDNRISAVLSEQDLLSIQNNIIAMQVVLENVTVHSLTPQERHEMVKMGDKSVAFVQKSLDYAKINPRIVPEYLDVEEAEKDLKLASDLLHVRNQLATLLTSVDDALMLSGSEAMDGALIFYNAVRNAIRSNVPGSQAILEDLQQRFPRKRSKTVPKPDVNG